MISNDTKNKIVETARIEEVVGEFVSLKKRGVNLLGLCPFHNEKTPSFTVSPAKGFYKCFGCGKAGDSVTFIMEHEHYSFPEALRFLAQKYNIEIEETAASPEMIRQQDDRESLYIVTSYAQKFYSEKLFRSEEGKAIGLTYFEERGFNQQTIEKFQLGYSGSRWDEFTQSAIKSGYSKQFLVQSGLTISKEQESENTDVQERLYDRFRSRVIFPIHNLSGRIIGFGGRILTADPKQPKYVNSPESEIYNKSKSLYGIYLAKKTIVQNDECFLVEGYTDVISLHQAGIENAVASSGTSLTHDQIRIVSRFTKNITILYDGDFAGIKASLRGIDLILEEGLNVKVVLFPDGDDPDSYSKKVTNAELKRYIQENAKDFIAFKTELLLKDVANDPVKKAGLIRDIVTSISKIPDGIIRSTYIKECSVQLDITEEVLISELNKLRRLQFKKENQEETTDELFDVVASSQLQPVIENNFDSEKQEEELIRILLRYGDKEFLYEGEYITEEGKTEKYSETVLIRKFMVEELMMDGIGFDHELYAGIFSVFSDSNAGDYQAILNSLKDHNDQQIKIKVIDLLSDKYEIADWNSKGIFYRTEEQMLKHAAMSPVYRLKIKRLKKMVHRLEEEMKAENVYNHKTTEMQQQKIDYQKVLRVLTAYFGTVTV